VPEARGDTVGDPVRLQPSGDLQRIDRVRAQLAVAVHQLPYGIGGSAG
jgi:hypothetical protein